MMTPNLPSRPSKAWNKLATMSAKERRTLYEKHIGPSTGLTRYIISLALIKLYCPQHLKHCRVCSGPLPFFDFVVGFRNFCTNECRFKALRCQYADWCAKQGVTNVSQLEWVKEKKVETQVANWGADHYMKTEEGMSMYKEKLKDIYGDHVTNVSQIPGVYDKKRETWLRKYGVDNPNKSPIIKAKKENVFVERYGVKQIWQSPEVQRKGRDTMRKRFNAPNAENPMDVPEIRERIVRTSLSKWGVTNPSKSNIIKQRIKDAFTERYGEGVTSAMHVPAFFEKVQDRRFRRTSVDIGNGATIRCQGYERQAIVRMMERGCTVSSRVPFIRYKDKKRDRIYYPDAFVKTPNGHAALIEVKSTYTLGLKHAESFKKNVLKFRAAEKACAASDRSCSFYLVLVHGRKADRFLTIKNPSTVSARSIRKLLAEQNIAIDKVLK